MFLFSVHPLTEETLRGFRPSKGFLGAAGLTLGEGMSSTNLPHSQAMFASQHTLTALTVGCGKNSILSTFIQ